MNERYADFVRIDFAKRVVWSPMLFEFEPILLVFSLYFCAIILFLPEPVHFTVITKLISIVKKMIIEGCANAEGSEFFKVGEKGKHSTQ